MSTFVTPQTRLVDEVHDLLLAHSIRRPDARIEYALDAAAVEWSGRNLSGYALATEIRAHEDWWHDFLHGEHGVLDLLEIDSEDTLYDREASIAAKAA